MENDFEFIEVRCINCGFLNDVTRRQVRLGERIICTGCHEDVQLSSALAVVKNKEIRCTVCYREFSRDEVRGAICCPNCGTTARPHKIADDVTPRINWHELRLVAQCVDAFLMMNSDHKKAEAVLNAILERLKIYQPAEALPLTLISTVREVLEEHGHPKLLEGGNVRVPEKYVWEIE